MKLYFAHPRINGYKSLYAIIRASPLLAGHEIVLPHEHSEEPFGSGPLMRTFDLVIGEVSEKATGVGIELGWADAARIPVACVYEEGRVPATSLSSVSTVFEPYGPPGRGQTLDEAIYRCIISHVPRYDPAPWIARLYDALGSPGFRAEPADLLHTLQQRASCLQLTLAEIQDSGPDPIGKDALLAQLIRAGIRLYNTDPGECLAYRPYLDATGLSMRPTPMTLADGKEAAIAIADGDTPEPELQEILLRETEYSLTLEELREAQYAQRLYVYSMAERFARA